MDGTQSSFIIDEDVLWMSQCCCGLKSAVCVSERCVCGSATFFVFLGGGWGPRLPEKVGSCYFRGSSCQFLLTEAHSAVSIMYDCVSRARMVSDSLIKLEENKGII